MILPLDLQRRVDAYLGNYLAQKPKNKDNFRDNTFSRSSSGSSVTDEGLFDQPEPMACSKAVMDNVIRRRSLQLLSQQRDWQVSFLLTKCGIFSSKYCWEL